MKPTIKFISAGAGSGKTHYLTKFLHEELSSGRVTAQGVIATTFTRKAATELRERVRGFLLEVGEFEKANSMGQARIGTVNGVCGELLQRFAFEAKLPTRQVVVEEEQANVLLMRAIDMVQDGDEASRLDRLNTKFSVDEKDWKENFQTLVATVRSNNIQRNELDRIKKENVNELLSHFPSPTKTDLTKQLIEALEEAIRQIRPQMGTVKKTADYLENAEQLLRGLHHGNAEWREWVKISKEEPAKGLIGLIEEVQSIAKQVTAHEGLQKELSDYIEMQFDLCARVLDVYQEIKLERGVIDFTDQERLLLELLDNEFVAETLKDELDLLMVDEFQDTSPIQLALFLRLAHFAKQVVWVGDIKQAIYGFRGSDSALMESVLKELTQLGEKKETLEFSWRSRKPLVELVNAVFVPVFNQTMDEGDIALTPQRKDGLTDAPYAFWNLSGTVEKQIEQLGLALRQVIESAYNIIDKSSGKERRVSLGDIAILRRSNENVKKTAIGLRKVGIAAMTEQPGLLVTPEAVLAMACLRRLNDPGDTLASAEIISLCDCSDPEDWVADRLRYLETDAKDHLWRETGEHAHPVLVCLMKLREELSVMSPAEVLSTAIAEAQLPARVLRWSASADKGRVRIANLDALVEMASQYERVCEGAGHAASVSGLLLWLDEQSKNKTDSLALPSIDAVKVMTHHAAKGLEWPVVVLMDLHGEVKQSIWDSVRAYSRSDINAAEPLKDRSIRMWPWPFGQQKAVPIRDEVAATPFGIEMKQRATEEAQRLLYVSMTRARDFMIIALPEKNKETHWLDTLAAPWLKNANSDDAITLPSGESMKLLPLPDVAVAPNDPENENLYWFDEPQSRIERLPRVFNPSKAESPSMNVLEMMDVGKRVAMPSHLEWTDVGHAVHAVLALAFIDMQRTIEVADTERILTGYELNTELSAEALTQQLNTIVQWVAQKWPGAKALPEWPIETLLENGQVINGRIDLLIDAGDHWVLVDHKSFPGPRSEWPELANRYGGQLMAYKNALEQVTKKPVKEIWLLLPVAAGAVRVEAS